MSRLTFETSVTDGTRLGAMYGLSTFVISSRRVSAAAACHTLPYVTMVIGILPIGTPGRPVSTVYVPRVTSCLSPVGVTSNRRTLSCTLSAVVNASNVTVG